MPLTRKQIAELERAIESRRGVLLEELRAEPSAARCAGCQRRHEKASARRPSSL